MCDSSENQKPAFIPMQDNKIFAYTPPAFPVEPWQVHQQ